MRRLILAALLCLLAPALASANDFGAAAHAQWVHQTRRLQHAPSPTGIEVICLGCNAQTAVIVWQNSPPHRALLPRVRVIRCVGDACVGR